MEKIPKIALVTGGSRGIGAATVKGLIASGYKVAFSFHQNEAIANQIVAQAPFGQALAIRANLSNENDIITMFESINNEWGPICALVNNAGTNGAICKVEAITAELLESVFKTNVFGTYYCTREAIKHMKQLGKGNIVNVSSEAAKFGGNSISHYAASKAAINTFTIAVARELSSFNIRVNAISPGVIDTDMHKNSPPERKKKLLDSIPMQRMGSADEVASAILWLLSDESSYISGAIIPVNGAR